MQQELKVGIAGAGFIAPHHLEALHRIPRIQVLAICDTDARRRDALQQHWNIRHGATTVEEMLERVQLDVVDVLLPPPLHASAATACLLAGRDVFVEKPLATTSSDCRELRLLAQRASR